MKEILVGAVAAAVTCGIAFADTTVNFYNKVYSEDPIVVHHFDKWDGDEAKYDTDVYFPGIKERMYADISTDKVDAGVKRNAFVPEL